jgi:hypothetical protein
MNRLGFLGFLGCLGCLGFLSYLQLLARFSEPIHSVRALWVVCSVRTIRCSETQQVVATISRMQNAEVCRKPSAAA